MKRYLLGIFLFVAMSSYSQSWNSKWLSVDEDGRLNYVADEEGNIIPDFSGVGYHEGELPPQVEATIEIEPQEGDDRENIQNAINTLAKLEPDARGLRGCVLLKKGIYEVSGQITISSSGIVIKGEGNNEEGTLVIATGRKQYSLFKISGSGGPFEIPNTGVRINMDAVPVGAKKIAVANVGNFKVGDHIIVYRPGTSNWITDLKMDEIEPRDDGGEIKQWNPGDYSLQFQRQIEAITGDTLLIDNPIVMRMEEKYGGGFVYKYAWGGRISECGIENLLLKSVYENETDENHAWDAIKIEKASNCWVQDVTAMHFGYSAVNISSSASKISVLNCKCLEAKSQITGSRRYSFNCNGQLNLFKNCEATEGRHDFITGSRVCGPNVFTQCKATNTHADIGPHQRWATGTLYDVIHTDGEINVQDRGNYGSGHGWAGATQVVWNCRAGAICVQNPWVSAKNYAIGCIGVRWYGRHTDRPKGEWEGFNLLNLEPQSLYEAQVKHRKLITGISGRNMPEKEKLANVAFSNTSINVECIHFSNSGTFELFNLNGQKLGSYALQNKVNRLEISGLNAGIYIYHLRMNDECQRGKIVFAN